MNIKKLRPREVPSRGETLLLTPSSKDFMNKINEIIDYINTNEEVFVKLIEMRKQKT